MTDVATSATPSGMTTSQRARQDRMVRAAMQLAAKGGYDAVQMRDVAEHAEVALGTLYRYFPSKVHLLIALLQDQSGLLQANLDRRPAAGGDAIERVMDVLRRGMRAFEREPQLTEAMFRALMFADMSAAREVQSVTDVTCDLFLHAMDPDRSTYTDEQRAIAMVIAQVWQTSVLNWLSGRMSARDMHGNVETAVRLLLKDEG